MIMSYVKMAQRNDEGDVNIVKFAEEAEYPRLLDLKCKKTHHISKRTFKIGWGDHDLVLPDEDCRGLCCEIVSKDDEILLFPFSILTPCLVNDAEVDEQTILRHGCTIKLGKSSLFRFEQSRRGGSGRNSLSDVGDVTGIDGPPPKPKRIYNKPQLPENGKSDQRKCDRGSYSELSDEWCVVVQPDIDTDLIQQLQSPEQIAHLASSYMSRQLMMLTDVEISPHTVDQVFKALREVVQTNELLILDFLRQFCEKNDTMKEKDKNPEKDAGRDGPSPELPCHGPLIKLLLDLLRFSLDPVEHNILWMSVLAKLSVLEENQQILLKNKAGAVLLGTMAAHLQSHEIQEYACTVLAHLAKYKPTPQDKGAVRQCAVELVVNAMERHLDKPNVLRPACRLLSNVVNTTSEVTAMTVDHVGFNSQEFDKMVLASLEMIDYIQDSALPVLESVMLEYPKDFSINFDGKQVKEYYQSPSKFKQKKEMAKNNGRKDDKKNISKQAKHVKTKVEKKERRPDSIQEASANKKGQVCLQTLENTDQCRTRSRVENLSLDDVQYESDVFAADSKLSTNQEEDGVLSAGVTDGNSQPWEEGAFREQCVVDGAMAGQQYQRVQYLSRQSETRKERKKWAPADEPSIPAELVGLDNTIHSRRKKKLSKSAPKQPTTTTPISPVTTAVISSTAVEQKQTGKSKVSHSEVSQRSLL